MRGLFLDQLASRGLLEISGLTVRYVPAGGIPVNAISNIFLTVNPAEVVGIIGESGSGKSTLAGAMLKLLPPRAEYVAGSIQLDGEDVLAMTPARLQEIRGSRIAMIPQEPATALNPVLKIGTEIEEVLRAHLSLSRRERNGRALDLLQEVGFQDAERIYSAYPHELSGGQRQRVVIAQAMACRPALVIADEPTSKLDAALQADILAVLANLVRKHGAALILITHDPAILIGFANRIVVMYAGQIVEEGSAENVVRNPLHPYTQSLLRLVAAEKESGEKAKRFPAIEGEPPNLVRHGLGCRFETRCPERMPICLGEDPKGTEPEKSHRVSCFKYAN